MKTPDEIKKALRICSGKLLDYCDACNYCNWSSDCACNSRMCADALDYIQLLEHQIGELTEKVAQLDHVTRERDALLEIVKELGECNYCKHNSYCPHTIPDCMNCKDGNCQCYSCGHQSKWQWSGVQEANDDYHSKEGG